MSTPVGAGASLVSEDTEVDDDMAIPDTAVADYELPSTTEVPPPPTPTTTTTTTGTDSHSPPSTWAQSQLVSSYLTQPARAQVEFPNPTLAPHREFGPRLLSGLINFGNW